MTLERALPRASLRMLAVGVCVACLGFATAAQQRAYAGEDKRSIKALSDKDIEDLLAGRGMGLAKAAELNSYPGPMHVLEHADALALSAGQRVAVQAIHTRMTLAAQSIGREIVARERHLDAAFAQRRIDWEELARSAEQIGTRWGKLRAVHLAAHLETRATLSPAQISLYARLRGYDSPSSGPQHPAHRHH
jgi:hypothetical protein